MIANVSHVSTLQVSQRDTKSEALKPRFLGTVHPIAFPPVSFIELPRVGEVEIRILKLIRARPPWKVANLEQSMRIPIDHSVLLVCQVPVSHVVRVQSAFTKCDAFGCCSVFWKGFVDQSSDYFPFEVGAGVKFSLIASFTCPLMSSCRTTATSFTFSATMP